MKTLERVLTNKPDDLHSLLSLSSAQTPTVEGDNHSHATACSHTCDTNKYMFKSSVLEAAHVGGQDTGKSRNLTPNQEEPQEPRPQLEILDCFYFSEAMTVCF